MKMNRIWCRRIDGAFNLDRKLSEDTGICHLDIIMLGSGMIQ